MKPTKFASVLILLSTLIAPLALHSCTALAPPERSFRCRRFPAAVILEKSYNFGDAVRTRRMPTSTSSLASKFVNDETQEIMMGHSWSRRSSLFALVGLGGTSVLAVSTEAAVAVIDIDNSPSPSNIDDESAQKAAAKERMAQRIAESKLKYRKPTDLVIERKENTDYSCVSTSGSPCPEGLVPAAVQRELVGVLQKKIK